MNPTDFFSYAHSFKVKVCLPAILKLAVVHLQSDPFQTCTSYINSGLTNAIQKSSRCPKNPHCLSCADELSRYLLTQMKEKYSKDFT